MDRSCAQALDSRCSGDGKLPGYPSSSSAWRRANDRLGGLPSARAPATCSFRRTGGRGAVHRPPSECAAFVRRLLKKLVLPLYDLVGAQVKLLGQFHQRLFASGGGKRHFRLESRTMVPARSTLRSGVSAQEKVEILEGAGVAIVPTPSSFGETVAEVLSLKTRAFCQGSRAISCAVMFWGSVDIGKPVAFLLTGFCLFGFGCGGRI